MATEITFLFLILTCLNFSALGLLRVRNNKIYDEQGGERIFHGLNVVGKTFPYTDHFTQEDMKLFKEWGMNGLRLGVMWSGVEPREGYYNQSYLQVIKNTVDLAAKYNIYTLLDCHQDLYSEKFCADGVPVWAIPESVSRSFPWPLAKPYKFDPVTGLPNSKDCSKFSWGTYYATLAVNRGFNHLWTNKKGLLDKFAGYWKKVAQTFKGNDNVIAYQLMNEPWPGNMYNNPFQMIPQLSELTHLQNAYDKLSAEIRSIDPNQNICFQPVTWLNAINAGFQHPPGGFKNANSSIFCYHFYKPPSLNSRGFMHARMRDIKRLKSGGLLSQFYVIDEAGRANVDIMDLCDQFSQSWLGWYYQGPPKTNSKFVGRAPPMNFQALEEIQIQVITRTFAQRIAGELIHQKFSSQTKDYTMSYYNCASCGETIIYFSTKYQYKKGVDVDCRPAGFVTCQVQEDIYLKVRSHVDKIQILVQIQELI